jgi:hypothetical protein
MGGTPRKAGAKVQRQGGAEEGGRYIPLGGLLNAQSATPDREMSPLVVEQLQSEDDEPGEVSMNEEGEKRMMEEVTLPPINMVPSTGAENSTMVQILVQQMQNMQQLFNCAMEDREKDRRFLLERDKEQQLTINRLMEERSRTPSERGDALSASHTQIMLRDRATMEASKGEFKTQMLADCELPDEWPKYEWPKGWPGGQKIVRALLAMMDLQKNFTIQKALKEIKRQDKVLFANDWRIVKPFLEGKEGKDNPHTQDVWELCLLGVPDMIPAIPTWLFICRNVKPGLVGGINEWNTIIGGGEWPHVATEGFKVGKKKDFHTQQKKLPAITTTKPTLKKSN